MVVLPAPGRYLSAPFNLTSHLTFTVEAGAVLLATTNASLWPVLPCSRDGATHSRMLYAKLAAVSTPASLINAPITASGDTIVTVLPLAILGVGK